MVRAGAGAGTEGLVAPPAPQPLSRAKRLRPCTAAAVVAQQEAVVRGGGWRRGAALRY